MKKGREKMNLTDDKVMGVQELVLNDALESACLYLKISLNDNTIIPTENDLIIYIDKASYSNPTEDRKQYIFELQNSLQYFNEIILVKYLK